MGKRKRIRKAQALQLLRHVILREYPHAKVVAVTIYYFKFMVSMRHMLSYFDINVPQCCIVRYFREIAAFAK